MAARHVIPAIAVALAGAPAVAGPVTSYEPGTIVAALQNAGYKAKLSKDDDGDPQIDTASDGNDIHIALSGCNKGSSCNQIEFLVFWKCGDELKKCQKVQDEWNGAEMFTGSLIIDEQIGLYRHLLLDKEGISEALFIRNFDLFTKEAVELMSKF